MADEKKPPFTEKERYLLDVQRRLDMAEFYPDGPEARWLQERARLAEVNPEGPEARQLREEARMAKLHSDVPETHELRDQNQKKEVPTEVTPEQKANADKALSETQLSDKIGGASDAGGKTVPNEPTPLDKARDIGQDLHRSGMITEPDK
jgi:hypothetical protein